MTESSFAKGSVLYNIEDPMDCISIIRSGKVKVSYPGGSYVLETDDVLGVAEICSEIHFLRYEALDPVTLTVMPVSSMEAMENMASENPEDSRRCLTSAFKQISTLLYQSSINSVSCSELYRSAVEDFKEYEAICNRHAMDVKTPAAFNELEAYLGDDAPDYWLNSMYNGLYKLYSGPGFFAMIKEASVTIGLLRKCSLDFRRTYIGLEEQYRYLKRISDYYLFPNEDDLLSYATQLYFAVNPSHPDSDALFGFVNRLLLQVEDLPIENKEILQARQNAFFQHTVAIDDDPYGNKKAEAEANAPVFPDAMEEILAFAKVPESFQGPFVERMKRFAVAKPDTLDEEIQNLKARLTEDFYALYTAVFERTLEIETIPDPVRLFLYFGYIDDAMAGPANVRKLLKYAAVLEQTKAPMYSFYHWLLAIYHGEKQPSRNEFEIDYSDYVRVQKTNLNLTNAETAALENDFMAKVRYELANMFPSGNKAAFGRIGAFFPFFLKSNVLMDLDSSFVTLDKLASALEVVQKVDYSVFYRPTLDKENMAVMGKLPVHLEFLPDIILMPGIGVRGVMWQEIECRVRASASRMLFSAFYQEDFQTGFIRLCGEYRWEMCKRIQGGRWNDISDASLTSEYFDYIQFYRKNHDLSAEAKEKVRISLQRAKNSFKEMFIRDYLVWILYEGNGSPRLNKVARRILFTYCPFPNEITLKLLQNPMYLELLQRHRLRTGQQLHLLYSLSKKLQHSGKPVPITLEREITFYERTMIDIQ